MARAATREAVSHFADAVECSRKLNSVLGGAERLALLHLALANAIMQAEGYTSDRMGRALDEARWFAEQSNSAVVTCRVTLIHGILFYTRGTQSGLCDACRRPDCEAGQPTRQPPPCRLMGGQRNRSFQPWGATAFLGGFRQSEHLNCALDRDARSRWAERTRLFQLLSTVRDRWLYRAGLMTPSSIDSFLSVVPQLSQPFDVAWALLARGDAFVLLGQDGPLIGGCQKQSSISATATDLRLVEVTDSFCAESHAHAWANWRRPSLIFGKVRWHGGARAWFSTRQSAPRSCATCLCKRVSWTKLAVPGRN